MILSRSNQQFQLLVEASRVQKRDPQGKGARDRLSDRRAGIPPVGQGYDRERDIEHVKKGYRGIQIARAYPTPLRHRWPHGFQTQRQTQRAIEALKRLRRPAKLRTPAAMQAAKLP